MDPDSLSVSNIIPNAMTINHKTVECMKCYLLAKSNNIDKTKRIRNFLTFRGQIVHAHGQKIIDKFSG